MNKKICKISSLYTLLASLPLLLIVGCGDDSSSTKATDSDDDSQSASDILDEFSDYLSEGDWSWDVSKEDYLNPKIEYGTLKDSRDGKVYKTIKIDGQTWMAENLNYADSSKTPSLKGKNWCYDNNAKNCDVAGRLYTWAAAIDSVKLATDEENPQKCGYGKPCSLPSRVQGICPEDWHIPNKDEWESLIAVAGGSSSSKNLKSQKGWNSKYIEGNGSDKLGFSALPAGLQSRDSYSLSGQSSEFWSSSQYDTENAYSLGLAAFSDNIYLHEWSTHEKGISVRCIKDNGEPIDSSPVYDSITDPRDSQVYKTVQIGKQTWMAENLNYADSTETPSLEGHSWCYDEEEDNCSKYGRLYTWSAAIDSAGLYKDKSLKCGLGKNCELPSKVQGICPEGWHLPSQSEWETLIDSVGGEYRAGMVLKSRNGWKDDGYGSDVYGFSALPAGKSDLSFYSYVDEEFYKVYFNDEGKETHFWTSTPIHYCHDEYDEKADDYVCKYEEEYEYNYASVLDIDSQDKLYFGERSKEEGFSIRCIKD